MYNGKAPKYGNNFDMMFQPFSYKACISDMGQWYSVDVNSNGKIIHFRDSAKLLPLTLKQIGEGFDCKYKKLNMEYTGTQHRAFGPITKEEMDYIKNDVLCLSEGVAKARQMGLKELTIASCALKEFKNLLTDDTFDGYFPDLTAFSLPTGENAYQYVKKAYAGGWVYVNPKFQHKVFLADERFKRAHFTSEEYTKVKNILCVDINSLYPWSLHSVSDEDVKQFKHWTHHYYPIGAPTFHEGEPTEEETKEFCVFRRFKCHFDLKDRAFPFVHIRNSKFYRPNECQITDKILGHDHLPNGESTIREFTMTQVDFELFCDMYNLTDYEPINYITFEKEEGIFDTYIDKWMANKIKGKETDNKALTTISKLLLNALYGKLSAGVNAHTKFCYVEDGVLKFRTHYEYDAKKPVALAAGAWCTSVARNYTIRTAVDNFEQVAYSDTDSLHLVDIDPDELVNVPFDKTKLGYWDCEISKGAVATYVKQKTYLEIATEESFKPVDPKKCDYIIDNGEKVWYDFIMKAAGLSSTGKEVFRHSVLLDPSQTEPVEVEIGENKDTFKISKLYFNDFRPGFGIKKCNLKCKQIQGGVLLVKDDFSLN